MQPMTDSMQVFDLQKLAPLALDAVVRGEGTATTQQVAVALSVPFWVADALLDAQREHGNVIGSTDGTWRLSLSAGLALALTMQWQLRAGEVV